MPEQARKWESLWDGTRSVHRSSLQHLSEEELVQEKERLEQMGIQHGWIESKGLDKSGIERFCWGRMENKTRIREYVSSEALEILEPMINRRRIIEQINQIQRHRRRGISRRGGKAGKS